MFSYQIAYLLNLRARIVFNSFIRQQILAAVESGRDLAYFTFGDDFAFLLEKGALADQQLWRASFYVHVAGGMVCLLTGPLLLWNGVRGGNRRLHVVI